MRFERLQQQVKELLSSNREPQRPDPVQEFSTLHANVSMGHRSTAPQNIAFSRAPQPLLAGQQSVSQAAPIRQSAANHSVVQQGGGERSRGLQSRDMLLSEFSGAANESLEAWVRMAQLKQKMEGLTDEQIFTAAVFKLRGDALAYCHLCEDQFYVKNSKCFAVSFSRAI